MKADASFIQAGTDTSFLRVRELPTPLSPEDMVYPVP